MSTDDLFGANERARIYARIMWRNKIISVLRIGVPVLGGLIFAYLILQIILANLAPDFAAQSVRIERGGVVIEKPSYSGTMANGTRYEVFADEAQKKLVGSDVLDLINITVDIVRLDGYTLQAVSTLAHYDLLNQTVTIPGIMIVDDSDQTHTVLHDSKIDWTAQTLISKGDVKVAYPDGTVIDAVGLKFDADTAIWDFGPTIMTTASDSP